MSTESTDSSSPLSSSSFPQDSPSLTPSPAPMITDSVSDPEPIAVLKQDDKTKLIQQPSSPTTIVKDRSWNRFFHVAGCLLAAAMAIAVFFNALDGDFAFDDNLALVSNQDTQADKRNWREAFIHDFWGADITSTSSHKSYRPFTILIWRALRTQTRVWYKGMGGGPESDPDLRSFPFHLLNSVLHAVNTMLVYAVAFKVFSMRKCFFPRVGSVSSSSSLSSSTNESKVRWQCFITAAVFALHPVHCESVTGIVGFGDCLSTIFYLSSFLVWVSSQRKVDGSPLRACLSLRLFVACVCMCVGILCKEICATVPALMSLHDLVFYASAMSPSSPPAAAPAKDETSKNQSNNGKLSSEPRDWRKFAHACFQSVVVPVGVRCILTASLLLSYVKFRAWLGNSSSGTAIGHEVFRHIENPIAFAKYPTKHLSIVYIHWRYFWLLLWPEHLSADYSFNCIPLVTSAMDPRFIAPMLFYGVGFSLIFLVLGLYMRSHLSRYHQASAPSSSCCEPKSGSCENDSRVLCQCPCCQQGSFLLACAWLIVPFLPSSSIFFPIGTLIAERLLYLSVIGYGMLVALFITNLSMGNFAWLYSSTIVSLSITSPVPPASIAAISASDAASAPKQQRARRTGHARRFLIAPLCTISLISALSYRTYLRNLDWLHESTLFEAALLTCPNSVKVLQNVGILRRREENYGAALELFFRAKEIEPLFCDVNNWIGITYLNFNEIKKAVHYLKLAVSCIYTKVAAAELIQKLMQQLLNHTEAEGSAQGDAMTADQVHYWQEWQEVLHLVGQHTQAFDSAVSVASRLLQTTEEGNFQALGREMLRNVVKHPNFTHLPAVGTTETMLTEKGWVCKQGNYFLRKGKSLSIDDLTEMPDQERVHCLKQRIAHALMNYAPNTADGTFFKSPSAASSASTSRETVSDDDMANIDFEGENILATAVYHGEALAAHDKALEEKGILAYRCSASYWFAVTALQERKKKANDNMPYIIQTIVPMLRSVSVHCPAFRMSALDNIAGLAQPIIQVNPRAHPELVGSMGFVLAQLDIAVQRENKEKLEQGKTNGIPAPASGTAGRKKKRLSEVLVSDTPFVADRAVKQSNAPPPSSPAGNQYARQAQGFFRNSVVYLAGELNAIAPKQGDASKTTLSAAEKKKTAVYLKEFHEHCAAVILSNDTLENWKFLESVQMFFKDSILRTALAAVLEDYV